MMFDSMRGWNADGNSLGWLMPNKSSKEGTLTIGNFRLTSTGFEMSSGYSPLNNGSSSSNYIYMAIRRGPLAQPESGTEVFAIDIADGNGGDNPPQFVSGFPVDAAIIHYKPGGSSYYPTLRDRLRGTYGSYTFSSAAENSDGSQTWDFMNGHFKATFSSSYLSWMWKRAPGFFDVVAYTGSNSDLNVSHNLGAVPDRKSVV